MNKLHPDKYDNGPEVLPPRPPKDEEGLQTVDARPYYYQQQPGLEPLNGAMNHQYDAGKSYYNSWQTDEKAPGNVELDKPISNEGRRTKRKWIICGIIVVIVVIIGVAVGAGVGVSVSNNISSSDQDQSSQHAPASTSTTSTSTPSATSSAVTSGGTGLAAFSCSSNAEITSSSGTSYTQECFTQYRDAGQDFYNSSDTIHNLGGKVTVYTMQSCLAQCDTYNSDRSNSDSACRGVTYYANLTAPVQMWGGNCFLKSGRGVGYNGDPVDYSHTASAWMTCLDSGSC